MFEVFLAQILAVATPINLGVLTGAVMLGVMFGALPGLTATLAVALLSTVTFGMPIDLALFALLGAYVGAIYGPCHSAILLGIPGTAAGAATALDGHPLAKMGHGGQAIATATVASVIGTLFGILAMVLISPLLIMLALNFTSVEFFLLALFGVLICGSLTSPDMPAKGWISGVFGLLLASVGIETLQGYQRFTFGIPRLVGGIDVVPVILGAFALPQIFRMMRDLDSVRMSTTAAINKMRPDYGELWRSKFGILRSGSIGVGIGTIPGVGEDIAAWTSYDAAKKVDRDPESFGKGNMRGVIAAETANNACIAGAIIPVLTLGIPGSPPAAMLLGALNLHNVRPGPMLGIENPEFIPMIAAVLFWASLCILVFGLMMARVSVRVLRIPIPVLMPVIAFLAVLGSYSLGLNIFNIYLMFLFGLVVYFLEELGYPVAPAVIGLILGTMADVNLRRALQGSMGSIEPFFTRPIALILLILIILSLSVQSQAVRLLYARATAEVKRVVRSGSK
jgi:putative tricarboxylic transport membrane protein